MSKAEHPPIFGPLDQRLRRTGVTLGQIAYAALAVTAVSGVVLGFSYNPGEPLASTEFIQGGVAYGFLFRAVHNLAAQLFIVTLLLHLVDHLVARSHRHLSAGAWWRLVVVSVLGLGAMFSGFLLRGDAEARAAQAIAASVLRVVPGVGDDLSRGLVGDPGGSLHVAYLHHLVTFTLAPWLLAIAHARRVWAGLLVTVVVAALITGVALVYHPGLGLPPGMADGNLWGPWYFIGVQELLRHLPMALVAGMISLGAAGALGGLGHVGQPPAPRWRVPEAVLRTGWLVGLGSYLLLCLIAYLARGTA